MTDWINDAQSAIAVLSITLTAEIGVFAMFYIAKDKVYEFLDAGDSVWFYAGIGAFLVGFLGTFAAFQLVPFDLRRRVSDFGILAISIAAGVANVALFYMLLNFRIF
jgi:hypothetical protein